MELAEDHAEGNSANDFDLGDLIFVETQVVAGTNYKLIYENDEGDNTEIIVFSQPWTNTMEVTGFKQELEED